MKKYKPEENIHKHKNGKHLIIFIDILTLLSETTLVTA